MNKILQGDCLEVLKEMESESVDCVVTSPPYWALRDYGVEGQLGLEPTFQEYITKLCDIFDEVKRVLKDEGTCWVNIGDTYSSGSKGDNRNPEKQREKRREGVDVNSDMCFGRHSKEWFAAQHQQGVRKINSSVPDKSLCCIPDRFKIEMINRGWICRNEIIWHKPNCMPSSVKDRFTVDFEKVFFFVKQKKYFFKTQYEPHTSIPWGKGINGSIGKGKVEYAIQPSGKKDCGRAGNPPQGRNKRCVWQVNTKPYKEAHFATYPEKLIEPIIDAGCPQFICKKCGKAREEIVERKRISRKELPKDDPRYRPNDYKGAYGEINGKADAGYSEHKITGLIDCGCNAGFSGGVVLDPFFGAGTTAVVALKQNKKYIGIELNPEYIKIAEKRLQTISMPLM